MSGSPEVTAWAALSVGDYIVDANGAAWQVGARRERADARIDLWLKPAADDGRKPVTLTKMIGHRVVTIDISPEESARRGALALLNHYLGGVVEMPKLSAVDEPLARAMLHAHLQCFHAVATTGFPMARLVSIHAIEHAAPGPNTLPHVHV